MPEYCREHNVEHDIGKLNHEFFLEFVPDLAPKRSPQRPETSKTRRRRLLHFRMSLFASLPIARSPSLHLRRYRKRIVVDAANRKQTGGLTCKNRSGKACTVEWVREGEGTPRRGTAREDANFSPLLRRRMTPLIANAFVRSREKWWGVGMKRVSRTTYQSAGFAVALIHER